MSLPTGAATVPLQSEVVQLMGVGEPALPPIGVTVTVADLVEAETYARCRALVLGEALGTTIRNCTATMLPLPDGDPECGGVPALGGVPPPEQADASTVSAAIAQARTQVIL
ncbi:MAG: hypothetical protein ACREM8_07270 [Vulcanimicrobiaceae bacterium]